MLIHKILKINYLEEGMCPEKIIRCKIVFNTICKAVLRDHLPYQE